MFDPVRIGEPQRDLRVSPVEPPAITSPAQIQRTLDDAAFVDRPRAAATLVDGLDDRQLSQLGASVEGAAVLGTLDRALASAPHDLDVHAQRTRLAEAMDHSVHPVDADPVGLRSNTQPQAFFERVVTDPVVVGDARTTGITERVGDNTVTWTVDGQGRPIRAEADLSQVFTDLERSNAETDAQREAADRGIEGDHGGHLIGHRFVTDQGLKNLFPQDGNFNVSAYKTLENEWADWIDSGMDVRIRIDLSPAGQDRPDRVRVSYEVVDPASGDVVYDQRVTFRNEAGQKYERVPLADMANYGTHRDP
ncbi:DNA/RNA non-specific endonuclease [Luteimonas cucumeris]|uniref:DNA/RNA non-specific endonuclease n=2 Tax=Luteimonas cucumeris TaxID=985012 RepID=A0A562LEV2_9GAMM|nr:DNA/RNA non-specific endonuclease [Luteimonas cucumeris]